MFLELWILHADEVALVAQLQAALERDPVAGRVVARALHEDGRLEIAAQPLMLGGKDEPFQFRMGREIPRAVPDGDLLTVVFDLDAITVDALWSADRVDTVVTLDLADGVSEPRQQTTRSSVGVDQVGLVLPGGDRVVIFRPTEVDPRALLAPAQALGDALAALPKRARAQRIEELLDGR